MNMRIWSAVAVIVIGYLVAMLYQTHHWDRRIDDLRSEVNHRFDDLKEWIRAEFRRIDERIDHLAGRVERLEAPFDKLEARFEQPTTKG
jgi:predicted nuclease with TOPRIM domain